MPNQFIRIIIVTLLFPFSQLLWADEIELEIKTLEARLIYEEAVKQGVDGKYNQALRRLDWLISSYPETVHGQLATDKRTEIALLLQQPKPISGISRAGLVGFGHVLYDMVGRWDTDTFGRRGSGPSMVSFQSRGPLSGLFGSLSLTRESETERWTGFVDYPGRDLGHLASGWGGKPCRCR